MAAGSSRRGGGSLAGRAVASVSAFLALAVAFVGLPYVLVNVAGNPLPDHVPTVDEIWVSITGPDDGGLFLGALAVLAWVAWATFALSVLVEVPAQLRGRRTARLPGLRLQQRLAAVLVGAVLAIVLNPSVSSALVGSVQGAQVGATPAPLVAAAQYAPLAVEDTPAHTADRALARHTVRLGESLLGVSERYGVSWEALARANYDVLQPDGRTLQAGEHRVYPGWTLRIPDVPVSYAAPSASAEQPQEQQAYEVVHGDWLGFIAERYLGDFDRYPEIAALNPNLIHDPDHIEPTWQLTLPADAYDHGSREHATGHVRQSVGTGTGQARPTPAPQPAPPTPAPLPAPAATPGADSTPETAPAPVPGSTAVPGESAAPTSPSTTSAQSTAPAQSYPTVEIHDGGAPADQSIEDAHMVKVATALGGAGLLAALAFAAVASHRRGQRQHHRTGRRTINPHGGRIETDLRVAQLPANVDRFDAALRSLAAGLADYPGQMPDPIGAVVDNGDVRLLLTATCPDPPPPWQDQGDSWFLPRDEPLHPPEGQIAALPSMAAIGSTDSTHLLLDLERVGLLILNGAPDRRADLTRYLASEVALNSWSDDVEVILAGFPPREADLLVALNPERVRAVGSVAQAAEQLSRRTATAISTLENAGLPDALAGRIADIAADSWMPQILFAAEPDEVGIGVLRDLVVELDNGGRCAVGVVVSAAPDIPEFGRWTIRVGGDGSLHLPFPLPYPPMTAASLALRDLDRLVEIMQVARDQAEMPVPPAPEPDLWARGTDAAGAILDSIDDPTQEVPIMRFDVERDEVTEDAAAERVVVNLVRGADERRPGVITAFVRDLKRDADPHLDSDLVAWRDADPSRPRIGILGPVQVEAAGPGPEHRRRFHAEIIVYLAQRAGRGANRDELDVALWPDRQVKDASRRVAITRARRWLGVAPDGELWLPDMGADGTYRLRPGYLLDWHVFRRLRTRATSQASSAVADLRAALELVRGVPLSDVDHAYSAGGRSPYPWLAESDIHPEHLTSAIVDTAHELATLYLQAEDTVGVRWAVHQAWLADQQRSYDHPWRDLMLAQHLDGRVEQIRATVAELMRLRDAEVPEELDPQTYAMLGNVLPELVRATVAR